MQPGMGVSNALRHSSHDLAGAEPVPAIPAWASDQLTNDEHQETLSS